MTPASRAPKSLDNVRATFVVNVAYFKRFYTSNTEYGLEKKWAYYNQQAIDDAANKPLYQLTPMQMLFAGKSSDGGHLIKSAQFLHKELPRRISRRIKDFQSLPYVAAINPTIQEMYELYLRAFYKLSSFTPIETREHEHAYSSLIQQLLDDHKDVVTSLAKSVQQVKDQVSYDLIGSFTERTLTSRLGIRLLAEHHLGLRQQDMAHFIGIICTQMSVRAVIEKCVYYCKSMCEHHYGLAPAVFVCGHTKAVFPYIPATLEYILQELLKNAMKATVVNHRKTPSDIPPIQVTICNNESHFIVKISDRGGGFPDSVTANIFKYGYSTTQEEEATDNANEPKGLFDNFVQAANTRASGGAMSGYGFGLPTSKAYAQYLGGTLKVVSMHGLGTDVFLRLAHISNPECFRI